MLKSKTLFICTNCGHSSAKWSGKCPECGEWNTLEEETVKPLSASAEIKIVTEKPIALMNIKTNTETRFPSGISELDRVLGGGVVEGSLILVGGEPGIGKSTLLMQICNNVTDKVLYVSGEESYTQIKLRASRLKVDNTLMKILCNTSIDNTLSSMETDTPKVVIIDSIHTMCSSKVSTAPGSVSQIKECTMEILTCAKKLGITVFIVGHVTKEGSIAGPRVLEHMVDCVLYFEGDRYNTFRILRAVKNRFGSTNEVGLFEMNDEGLKSISNPVEYLLDKDKQQSPGTCITCTMEGTRPLISEIEALVTPTFFPSPRRTASGLDYNRVVLLLAVLEKNTKVNLSTYDTYINIVGGMKLTEPASDLAVLLAIYSTLKDFIINSDTIALGEISLTGEVRNIPLCENRINEARKLGFKKIIVPYTNFRELKNKEGIIGVKNIHDAINAIK
ncbi:MAG: DNA repair protein RadA [Clostridia bacterium]|nr:DNA repair protein RadA [Clostridia bacterium]